MKTDRVLTMDECLNQWGAAPMQAEPPACDARHIPITKEKDVDVRTKARSCNCDRWGHPCPNCSQANTQPQLGLPISLPAKQLT
jgi:hypothetical protein